MRGQEGLSFLTPHARVLAVIARAPEARVRDIAHACRITERNAHRGLINLERAGFLTRRRIGRRNHYSPDLEHGRPHPAEAHLPVQALLAFLTGRGNQP